MLPHATHAATIEVNDDSMVVVPVGYGDPW
jgi:hypothetical protein